MNTTGSDPGGTITFAAEPDLTSFPAIVDEAFLTAVNQSKLGGEPTQQFFDALNQTSDFWGNLASGAITFAPGVDPQGKPVFMASDGNVEMRMTASYLNGDGGIGSIVGSEAIALRNTTLEISSWMAVAVRLMTMPPYLTLTGALFNDLLIPIYRNTGQVLTRLANRISQACRVETPSIDPVAEANAVTEAESGVADNVAAEVGEEGIEYMSIDWGAAVLEMAGIGSLMALPMIAEALGHEMTHALIVQNLTASDFTTRLTVIHGEPSLQPGQPNLPRLTTESDTNVPLSSQASFQVSNRTDYGAIGYVVQLSSSDGSPAATLVIDVPWAGQNTIWVGTAADPETAYDQHHATPGPLSVSAVFGAYKVTLSLNKTSGKTDDAYYYCSTAIIEPES